ncbi:patatin [Gigaspora margarita]|uniref:Patatin n=1 Tax=Gigaspora margarita TaxID=4874 RepID=A0A8H3XJ96_GIGMA|nr:patatin [Gigaspora margarita]
MTDQVTKINAKLPKVDDIDVKIANLFDFVAGTSTGAIIALGLVVTDEKNRPKFTAQEIVKIYEENKKKIFSKGVMKYLFSGLFQYDHKGIEDLLYEKFENKQINDSGIYKRKDDTVIKVLVPTFNITTNKRAFFTNYGPVSEKFLQKGMCYTISSALMKDAIRASTAAPAYFKSAHLKLNEKEEEEYVDGGVFMNNPSVQAYADAKAQFGESANIVVVSFGTGFYKELPKGIGNATARWLISFTNHIKPMTPIVNLMMTEESITNSTYLQNLLGQEHYYRFNIKLDDNIELDAIADDDIEKMKKTADKIMKEKSPNEFVKLVEILSNHYIEKLKKGDV